MKKLDYYIIGLGILILSIIGIIIYSFTKVDKDNVEIELLYKSEVVYILDLNADGIYKLECINGEVKFYKNNEVLKSFTTESKDFKNEFEISNLKIEMIDASCEGKDCTKMYITINHLIPIICTNGVVINPKTKTNVDVIA